LCLPPPERRVGRQPRVSKRWRRGKCVRAHTQKVTDVYRTLQLYLPLHTHIHNTHTTPQQTHRVKNPYLPRGGLGVDRSPVLPSRGENTHVCVSEKIKQSPQSPKNVFLRIVVFPRHTHNTHTHTPNDRHIVIFCKKSGEEWGCECARTISDRYRMHVKFLP
jgi:hypothetical protein